MTMLAADTRTIRLGDHRDCAPGAACHLFWADLYDQLDSGRYDYPASILTLTDMDDYLAQHRTARKRAARARRLGYTFEEIERVDHADDIYAINTSMPVRQGRPMSDGYRERQTFTPLPDYLCPRHRINTYGVLQEDTLVAYLVLYLSGDMVMVSQILGHADHLAGDVMYLLCLDAFALVPTPAVVSYNRWDSGTDGLRFFKARLGFTPERVAWAV